MKTSRFLIIISIGVLFLGCEGEVSDRVCCGTFDSDELAGKWLVYEKGYSPGFDYIVEDVPAFPAQTIRFNNGRVQTTGDTFKGIHFYEILTDTATNTQYVALYSDDPEAETVPQSTYSFSLDNSVLKLYFRWCYEGCHLGLKRVKE
jgi:hypothetical protein